MNWPVFAGLGHIENQYVPFQTSQMLVWPILRLIFSIFQDVLYQLEASIQDTEIWGAFTQNSTWISKSVASKN
jgi:hypothetical protein